MKAVKIAVIGALTFFAAENFNSSLYAQEHQYETGAQNMTIIGFGDMEYTCPMANDLVFSSEPGKCPKCGMNLIAMTPGQKAGLQKMTAQRKTPPKSGDFITLTGVVVDTDCFIRSGHKGAGHKMCAQMCAEAGIVLGVLDETTDNLYIVISEMGKNPNDKLLDYIANNVMVKGIYHERSGIAGIEIQEVEKGR